MKWCTKVEVIFPWSYGHRETYLFLGSCFAAAVGRRLRERQVAAVVNPVGTLFHPLAIASSLHRAMTHSPVKVEDLVEHEGGYWSLDHHGEVHPLAASSPSEVVQALGVCDQRLSAALEDAEHLILSFGSAWLYERQGRAVANCHRLPAHLFRRRCTELDEMLAALIPELSRWLEQSPRRRLTLTVSPVRHLRDQPQENSRSKARLHLLCEALEMHFPGRVWTFPAWELVIDELRDYRFYGDDLSHLSEAAEDYVFERFIAGFSAEGRDFLRDAAEWQRLARHRPRDAARHGEQLARAQEAFERRWHLSPRQD